jgi:hypothetical protein
MRSHIGLLPQCIFIVRSRAKVNRLEESYVSRAAQRPVWVESSLSVSAAVGQNRPVDHVPDSGRSAEPDIGL